MSVPQVLSAKRAARRERHRNFVDAIKFAEYGYDVVDPSGESVDPLQLWHQRQELLECAGLAARKARKNAHLCSTKQVGH